MVLQSYKDSIIEFAKKFKDLNNVEFEFDLNKDKDPYYIDFNVYSKLIKFLRLKSIKDKKKLTIKNILSLSYEQLINNKKVNYRLSLLSENNKPIPFIHKFKNSNNATLFQSLTNYYLKLKDKNIEYITKDSTDINNSYNIDDYNIRIRIKEEKPTTERLNLNTNSKITIRYKKRITYKLTDFISIDLSEVNFLNNISDFQSKRYTKQIYELEIEYTNKKLDFKTLDLDLINNYVNSFLKIIGNTNYLIPLSEKNKVIEEFSKLFKTPIDYKNPKLPYVNVVSMSRNDLYKVQNKFIVSDKIDGERGLLFTTNNKAYILTMDKKTIYTGFEIDKQYNNSVLDGEYVFNSKYHKFIFIVFDCLFVSNTDIRTNKSLIYRVQKGNELINKCFIGSCKFKSYDYDYKSKDQEDLLKFYEKHILEYQKMLTDNLQNIKSNQILIRHGLFLDIKGYSNNEVFKYADLMWKMYTNNINNYVYKSDGIIFHPKNANYYNYDIQEQKTDLLKWKPTNRNTIDFYIEFEKNPLTHKIESVYDYSNSKKTQTETTYKKEEDKTANIDNEESETNGIYKICHLYVSKQIDKISKPVIFNPRLFNNGDINIAYLPIVNGKVCDQSGNILMDKTIVEFYYDIDGDTSNYHFNWIPVKTRHDKTLNMRINKTKYGNADLVAYNIWNSINYPIRDSDLTLLANDKTFDKHVNELVKANVNIDNITDSTLTELKNQKLYESLAFYNNNFYNMVKTILCNTYLSNKFDNVKKSVLDIGVGYAMDIFKYYDAEVSNMVCIDSDYNKFINPKNGAIQRLERAKLDYPAFPNTTFINANIIKPFEVEQQESIIQNNTKENKDLITKYLSGDKKYDSVQCFNVFNEILKDDETLKIICDNINRVIQKNTIFIITMLNKDKVNEKLKDSKFTITYYTNNELLTLFEITNNEIKGNYQTVSILSPKDNIYPLPYYLIDEKYLIEELEKQCGLKLIENETFEHIFNNMKEYINISSEIDSEIKTRKFFSEKIQKFYEDTETNKKNQEIMFLYSYYVFIKA